MATTRGQLSNSDVQEELPIFQKRGQLSSVKHVQVAFNAHQSQNQSLVSKNIITLGWGVWGQVNLIDYQSMPDGTFYFFLNYIDHEVILLFLVPLVAKQASCIAIALYQIFCLIGPPMVL